jgi:hypothetical protein
MWGQEGIARRLGAGERFKGSAGEVLAGFEDKPFKFGDTAGVGCFLFECLEDGLHVLVKVGHGLSLQVPICGCTRLPGSRINRQLARVYSSGSRPVTKNTQPRNT